ncbi:glycine cleavage system protein R [Planctobacterium marinum]|uniref:glycine cleavage system protein R n=1 Tax=Planctobacterium marinum TaxID=1631968 RepID=UPI001E4297A8|nr:ACT domain-containing protein [Planctobacterium marinum]MCC2604996.1 glycine cleavage system protein R [Planctobacterium marinum]
MKSIVITLVGNDKPGLIDSIAKAIAAAKGNWQASSFAHMAGHFAGFAEIQIPEENEAALLEKLQNHPDLKITLSQGISAQKTDLKNATIEIEANDRQGIVQELTNVLNRFNLNIVQFESECVSAPNWGSLMFKATAEVTLPVEVQTEDLRTALEGLSDDLMVEIKL